MNDELERMWKEAVVAYINALSRHLSGMTQESYIQPQLG
jgi:hypothetical protein